MEGESGSRYRGPFYVGVTAGVGVAGVRTPQSLTQAITPVMNAMMAHVM